MDVYSLDIESRSLDPRMADYAALEPFRVRQGNAEISSMAVCRPDNSVYQIVNDCSKHEWDKRVLDLLRSLKGKRVFAHFAVFDVAWNIVTIEPRKFRPIPKEILDIQWACTALLTKWLVNGQVAEEAKFSYSLANLVETFLPEHPRTPEFMSIKGQTFAAGENDEYWETRGVLDVIMTKALAEKLINLVPESMRIGLMTEWADIPAIANSWCNGIPIDVNRIEEVESGLVSKMCAATDHLQVEGSVLSSPQQLGRLLFGDWGLRPWSYTGTKQPSTNGDDLMLIQHELKGSDPGMAQKLQCVLDYKRNKTLQSKYIKSMYEALSHSGDGYIYGTPKLFGTYTGRLTYSNTVKQKKYKTSIALHQLPRKDKEIRSLLIAPEGFCVIENDAAGQESRLIAIRSGDETMLDIFRRGLNFHSMTGAAIIGLEYNDFMTEYKKQVETGGYYIEQRQLGKLTNLSCNYRIGGPALAKKAFTEYDTYMTDEMGRFLVNTFNRQYSGVPLYWKQAVNFAKTNGYTECFGGRRYKISMWDGNKSWISESSAINMPIQGAGASMKEIAISVMTRKIPEALFALDLHDAAFCFAPIQGSKEIGSDLLSCLNSIDYEPFWGFVPEIPLPYESAIGANFGEVK